MKKPDGLYYRYGAALRSLEVRELRIPYLAGAAIGRPAASPCTAAITGRSCASRRAAGSPSRSCRIRSRALAQSYLRTKTRDYAGFLETQQMRTDTSNNTVYADADGTIAYFHGNFIPKRDPAFDYTHAVDGSNPETEWQGPHALDETIMLKIPPTAG